MGMAIERDIERQAGGFQQAVVCAAKQPMVEDGNPLEVRPTARCAGNPDSFTLLQNCGKTPQGQPRARPIRRRRRSGGRGHSDPKPLNEVAANADVAPPWTAGPFLLADQVALLSKPRCWARAVLTSRSVRVTPGLNDVSPDRMTRNAIRRSITIPEQPRGALTDGLHLQNIFRRPSENLQGES